MNTDVIEMAADAVAVQLKKCEVVLDVVKFADDLAKDFRDNAKLDEAIKNEWFLNIREWGPGRLDISVQIGDSTALVEDEKRPRRIFNWNLRALFKAAEIALSKRDAAFGRKH